MNDGTVTTSLSVPVATCHDGNNVTVCPCRNLPRWQQRYSLSLLQPCHDGNNVTVCPCRNLPRWQQRHCLSLWQSRQSHTTLHHEPS